MLFHKSFSPWCKNREGEKPQEHNSKRFRPPFLFPQALTHQLCSIQSVTKKCWLQLSTMDRSVLLHHRRLHSHYCAEWTVWGKACWRTGSPVVSSSCDFAVVSFFVCLEVPWFLVVDVVCVYFCDFEYYFTLCVIILFFSSLFLLLYWRLCVYVCGCECALWLLTSFFLHSPQNLVFFLNFPPLSGSAFSLFASSSSLSFYIFFIQMLLDKQERAEDSCFFQVFAYLQFWWRTAERSS